MNASNTNLIKKGWKCDFNPPGFKRGQKLNLEDSSETSVENPNFTRIGQHNDFDDLKLQKMMWSKSCSGFMEPGKSMSKKSYEKFLIYLSFIFNGGDYSFFWVFFTV